MGDRRLVAGIGCTSRAGADQIVALVRECLGALGKDQSALACVATTLRRHDHPGLCEAARRLGVALRCLDQGALAAQQGRLVVPSASVAGHTGLAGIAEAAALAAGELVLTKRIGDGVTCALAQVGPGFSVNRFGMPA